MDHAKQTRMSQLCRRRFTGIQDQTIPIFKNHKTEVWLLSPIATRQGAKTTHTSWNKDERFGDRHIWIKHWPQILRKHLPSTDGILCFYDPELQG